MSKLYKKVDLVLIDLEPTYEEATFQDILEWLHENEYETEYEEIYTNEVKP